MAKQPPRADLETPVAPWPTVDRYPIVIGQSLTLQYVASAFRNAQTGYRREYVDLLDELLEREPHGYAVLQQRIMAVAGGRLEISPAVTDENAPEHDLAAEIAATCDRQVSALPNLRPSLAWLLWSLYYGVTACEIMWARDGVEWAPRELVTIHSRRLAYPDPGSWDLRLWDMGTVQGWDPAVWASQAMLGLRLADYPGKFIVHVAQLRGDYPTRDGLGRQLADWFALKRMAARSSAQYLERFAKPWAMASYATSNDGTPRAANQDDINNADAAMRSLGIGALSSYTAPDSIKVDLRNPDGNGGKAKISYREFIELANAEISKAVLGQTLTTDAGAAGSRALGEVQKRGSLELARYDATCLADTLRRDLLTWIVRLNYPGAPLSLVPHVRVHVDEEPSHEAVIAVLAKAAQAGMPIDADAAAQRLGLKLTPNDTGKPRRLAPVQPVALGDLTRTDEELATPAPPAPEPQSADDGGETPPPLN